MRAPWGEAERLAAGAWRGELRPAALGPGVAVEPRAGVTRPEKRECEMSYENLGCPLFLAATFFNDACLFLPPTDCSAEDCQRSPSGKAGVAGTVSAFVAQMNAEAQRLGATHTHFTSPHGLYDPDHYSTAYDLALITRVAMRRPAFREIVQTRRWTFLPPGDNRPLRLAMGHLWGVSIYDLKKIDGRYMAKFVRLLTGHQGYVTALAA